MAGWAEITTAIGIAMSGDKTIGRETLMGCWNATSPEDHPQRCVLAHYLADTEPELSTEVSWDETALREHGFLNDADLAPLGIASARGMLPSLHLNLGDGYHRLGEQETARRHLLQGLAACDDLNEDGYGKMIRAGLGNLAQRIGELPA